VESLKLKGNSQKSKVELGYLASDDSSGSAAESLKYRQVTFLPFAKSQRSKLESTCLANGDYHQSPQLKAKNIGRFYFCLLPFALCLLISTMACSRGKLLDRAQSAWDNGDYAKAAEYYEQFINENPHSEQVSFARFRIATIYHRDLRKYDRAIEHYIHLIEDFPKSPYLLDARLRLSECYAATGKRQEAISEYENLLTIITDEKEKRRVRLNIAELYYELNDLGQAVAQYQSVTGNEGYDELSERAYLRIGGIRLLRNEFEDALSAYQAVAQNTGNSMIRRIARFGIADCYQRISQYDLAVKTLEETEPDPNSPEYIKQRITNIREQQRERNLSTPIPSESPRKKG
jgi:tetratricopeptide (TPR) repeat protein